MTVHKNKASSAETLPLCLKSSKMPQKSNKCFCHCCFKTTRRTVWSCAFIVCSSSNSRTLFSIMPILFVCLLFFQSFPVSLFLALCPWYDIFTPCLIYICFPCFISTWEERGACLAPTAKPGGSWKKEEKADAGDSVGAVMRVPTMEKQSVRPELAAHSPARAQNSKGVMGWQKPGASQADTHTITKHNMVNNEEEKHRRLCDHSLRRRKAAKRRLPSLKTYKLKLRWLLSCSKGIRGGDFVLALSAVLLHAGTPHMTSQCVPRACL